MKSIGIQFFATSDEVLSVLITATRELNLHFAVMTLRPFRIVNVDIEQIRQFIDENKAQNRLRVSLSVRKFNAACEKKTAFLDKNPNACHLDIGRFDGKSLEESFFSTKTEDEISYKKANEIAKRIRKMTHVGGTATNSTTGAKGYYKNIRYTNGAKELSQLGIQMKPVAGNTSVVFDKL